MIFACDAHTNECVQMKNPDTERDYTIQRDNGKPDTLWKMSRAELWGDHGERVLVYRSYHLRQLVWYYPKTATWVVLNAYDEDKEDNDKSYAEYIESLMSKPATFYNIQSITTMTTTTTFITRDERVRKPRGVKQLNGDIRRDKDIKRHKKGYGKGKLESTSDKLLDPKDVAHTTMDYAMTGIDVKASVASTNTDLKVTFTDTDLSKTINDFKATDSHSILPDTLQTDLEKSNLDSDEDKPLSARTCKDIKDTTDLAGSSDEDRPLSARKCKVIKDTPDLVGSSDEDEPLVKMKRYTNKAAAKCKNDANSSYDDVVRMQSELETLRRQNEMLQLEKDKIEKSATDKDILHANYKKHQGKSNREMKQKVESLQQDRDAYKCSYAEEKKRNIEQAQMHGGSETRRPCIEAYTELIHQCFLGYSEAITQKKKSEAPFVAKYQVMDATGTLIDLNQTMANEIDKLNNASECISYTNGQHHYEVRLSDAQGTYAIQKNTNSQHPTERPIFLNPKYDTKSTTSKDEKAERVLTESDKHDILFGASVVKLSLVDNLLANFDFYGKMYDLPSKDLAALAELFHSLCYNFKYVNGETCRTILYVKPAALFNFLYTAKSREYKYMRIVLHGSDSQCYEGVRKDANGMNMMLAGKMNGLAYGPGTYWGLSPHVTIAYNKENKSKPGTALMGLILTKKNLTEHHGSYTLFSLSSPCGKPNCINVHESYLQLVLGKIVSI